MRVLYVLDSLTPGGTERSTVTLLPWLRRHGVESVIVILREAENDLREFAEDGGSAVVTVQAHSQVGRVREVRRLIRRHQPDVVHTALYRADQIGRLASLGTGVPVVSSFVNTPYDAHRTLDPNVSRWKLRVAQLIDAATAHTCVTTFHAVSVGAGEENRRALRLRASKVVVAERGRDTNELGPCSPDVRSTTRSSLGLNDDVPVVLNVGRLDEQKGQWVLIEAVASLIEEHPDLTVLIAGKDGSASSGLRQILHDDQTTARHIQLLGHRTDIGALLCAADVLAISSHFEGTAGAALEAMAMGTPVVSTDLNGAVGVLEDQRNARVVPVADPRALAEGIHDVLTDAELASRLATNGRYEFEQKYTMDAAAQRLTDLYERVIEQRR